MQSLRRSTPLWSIKGGAKLTATVGTTGIRSLRSATRIVAAARRKRSDDIDSHNPKPNELSENEKKIAIERHVDSINKKYGRGTLMKLTAKPAKVKTFSTGLMSLDMIIGGGLPVGKIIEIFGPEGTGKSTLAWHMLERAQKPDNTIVVFDAENAIDRNYVTNIGINPERLMLLSPDSGDSAFDVMLEVIRARSFSALCIDSVASLVPMNEQGISMEESVVGTQARMMSRGLKQLVHANQLSGEENACTTIFINQLRNKIGTFFGNPEVRPGGRALPYYSTLSLDVRAGKKIEGPDGEIIGHKLKIKTIKNKIYPPYRTMEVDLIYGKGICRTGSLLDAAVQMNVVKTAGAYYYFGEGRLGQGRPNSIERLKEQSDLWDQVEKATRAEYEKRMGLDERIPDFAASSSLEEDLNGDDANLDVFTLEEEKNVANVGST